MQERLLRQLGRQPGYVSPPPIIALAPINNEPDSIADSANCCSGSHSTPQTCPPSGVQFYSYFSASFYSGLSSECIYSMASRHFIESKCPNSYVYAYDESSGSALWTCGQEQHSDYTITFCP